MGCCFSQPDGPNSPYPGGAPAGSGRAINVVASQPVPVGGHGNVSPTGDDMLSSPSTVSPGARTSSLPQQAQQQLQTQRVQQPGTLAQHINKPLRRRRWTSRNRVWTRHAIDRERIDFFDTRVTGRAEIWQTLHAALEVLWEADLVAGTQRSAATDAVNSTETANANGNDKGAEDAGTGAAVSETTSGVSKVGPTNAQKTRKDAAEAAGPEMAEALATAQTMLDAADITLPTGDPAQGAYDALGNFYPMPAWIVSDPTNIDNDPSHDLAEAKGALDDADGEEEGIVSEDDEEGADDGNDAGDRVGDGDGDDINLCGGSASNGANDKRSLPSIRRRREAKGKAVAVAADQIAVRARLSATSRDVVIHLGRDDTVRSLAHRISEEAKFPHKTRVRIAYLGKILKDSSSLESQGWKEGHVVNALVFDLS